ncbi:hypothetical protein [Tenacibaculum finnmarkense]|uniref:Uncharacterized protein n=1 Tax=Tenacibaculum finnmarkense genomovar finnmarkense TaxID=1458503 RepID=A0AAP1RHQ3_9FLAO|nr:hypothetical protein [Tenacibaculum finnmarkense]MBE7653875.1 hypothetical protein [Tenacibaculum finnmarkense genomovar finnmarkense]MBE7696178.1 hypothetical protein [Tenacibaculum finnmarkense genomovar finnmarkense]MCD8428394.1 hypothetical protein [Tenacibaculum finnmarkense genomovar finnmarkense]MCG8732166.1 hypothetical protein [Tenacibaculum finnmarkense]MCG8752747.1 hypothetical protein [Tenacibaculum finnmarkense]
MKKKYNFTDKFNSDISSYKLVRSALKKWFGSLSKKQMIGIVLVPMIFLGNYVFALTKANTQTGSDTPAFNSLISLLGKVTDGSLTGAVAFQAAFLNIFQWVETPRMILQYITKAQIHSVDTLAVLPFGNKGMFEHIYLGLTIFAVIGAIYKLITHFLKTERFDNVQAFTGFFSYLGVVVLFIFSGEIVGRVVGLNQNLKGDSLTKIARTLDTELANSLVADYKKGMGKVTAIRKQEADEEKRAGSSLDLTRGIRYSFKVAEIYVYDLFVAMIFKYGYFTLFSTLIVCILAIPTFVLAFMVKVLLGVMIAGTKLVFLVSMIPGFESTWKTYMLNLLNVILWVPIFNAIISFITLIIATLITSGSLASGEIVWLSIVCFICAYQAITLTTTAAGTIIQGAGASMAGALGGLAAMNGASALAGIGKAAVGGATVLATGGATAGMTAAAMSKHAK